MPILGRATVAALATRHGLADDPRITNLAETALAAMDDASVATTALDHAQVEKLLAIHERDDRLATLSARMAVLDAVFEAADDLLSEPTDTAAVTAKMSVLAQATGKARALLHVAGPDHG